MNRFRTVRLWTMSATAAAAIACGGGQPASAPADTTAPAAPKVLTGDERAKWYQECWNHFNNKAWDAMKACYADTAESDMVDSGQPVLNGIDAVMKSTQDFAVSFPDIKGTGQVVLVNGANVASLYLLTGTHGGPLPGPGGKSIPATNKKIGYLMGHVAELDATGSKVIKEATYADSGTLMAHIGMNPAPARPVMEAGAASPTVVVSSGSDAEAKNVEAFRASTDAFNKRDVKALAAFNTPDVVFHDLTQPKDMNAKENEAMMGGFFTAFPDARLTLDSSWGAGDYVVTRGTFEGTNKGAAPAMGIKKPTGKPVRVRFLEITRLEGGKYKEDWLIFDSMAFAGQLGLLGN